MSEDLTPESGRMLDGLKSAVDQAADTLRMEQESVKLIQLAGPGLLLYKFLQDQGVSQNTAETMMLMVWRKRFATGGFDGFDDWSEG